MATIEHYTTPPHSDIIDQIVEITMEYVSELSLGGIAPSNPLYSVHQTLLGLEMSLYLGSMADSPERKTEVIVAFDESDRSKVVGYILYLPLRQTPDACGISYMAVLKNHRNQGVAKAMMEEVLSRYPHAELSCFVEKVPFYQKLGFELIGVRNTQVRMNTRGKSADDVMGVLDTVRLFEHPVVKEQFNSQLQRLGQREMKQGQRQHDRNCAQLERRAIAYMQEHGLKA